MGIELPDDFPRRLEDALYVSVGLGVLAVQRAQVWRRELERLLARLRPDQGAGWPSPPGPGGSPA